MHPTSITIPASFMLENAKNVLSHISREKTIHIMPLALLLRNFFTVIVATIIFAILPQQAGTDHYFHLLAPRLILSDSSPKSALFSKYLSSTISVFIKEKNHLTGFFIRQMVLKFIYVLDQFKSVSNKACNPAHTQHVQLFNKIILELQLKRDFYATQTAILFIPSLVFSDCSSTH